MISKRKEQYALDVTLCLITVLGIAVVPGVRKAYKKDKEELEAAKLVALMTKELPRPDANIKLPPAAERRLINKQTRRKAVYPNRSSNRTDSKYYSGYYVAEYCSHSCAVECGAGGG